MSQEAILGLAPVGIMLAGFLLLWFASWRQQHRGSASPFASYGALVWTIFGVLLALVGLIAFTVLTALFLSPFFLLTIAVILLASMIRYWRGEARYLVWALAEAADRSIPLERAARAFATERGGLLAGSARTLADYLDAGVPLSVALKRARLGVSAELKVAADLGEKTGTLGTSLRRAIDRTNEFENAMGSLVAKFFYLTFLVFFQIAVLTFLMIKIVPTFVEMFEEFELALPAATLALIEVSRWFVQYWYLLAPLFMLFTALTLLTLLLYIGLPVQSLPILNRLAAPLDNATVLHSLAISVRQRQSIVDSLLLLSGLTRSAANRRRLGIAIDAIDQGIHWSDALQFARIISKAQNAVFRRPSEWATWTGP